MKGKYVGKCVIAISFCLLCIDASATIVDHEVKYGKIGADAEWSEERRTRARPMRIEDAPLRGDAAFRGEPRADAGVTDADGVQTRADVGVLPYKAGGKLFFDTPSGPSSCSAQFVGGSKRVLLTAAHCVVDDDGNWYENWEFYRAYHAGGGQQVRLECISIWDGYYTPNPDNPDYDYAFIYTQIESSGGTMGLKMIPYTPLTAIGYPAAKEGGQYMYKVSGTRGARQGNTVIMNDNTFEGGTSGGAWIGDLGAGDWAVGLNSRGTATYERSPYFDDTTWAVYQHVRGGGCN